MASDTARKLLGYLRPFAFFAFSFAVPPEIRWGPRDIRKRQNAKNAKDRKKAQNRVVGCNHRCGVKAKG
jgi:hypothetical protein